MNNIGPITHTYTLLEDTVIGEDYPTLYNKGTEFYFPNQWSMVEFISKISNK